MHPSLRIRCNRNQKATWFQNALAFSKETERIMHMLEHVVHRDNVKFLVPKCGLIETTPKNRDSEDASRLYGRSFVDLQSLDIPSVSTQLRQPLPVAAPYLQNAPRASSTQVHEL